MVTKVNKNIIKDDIMILYLYDLKIRGLNPYNTLKRRFYYNLNKSKLSSAPWRTKSVLLIPEELEQEADVFFSQFSGHIHVFKVRCFDITELVPAPNERGA